MANTTGNDRLMTTPWDSQYHLKLPYAIPGSSTTFYAAQLIGRDGSGNLIQADDTAKYELVGVIQDVIRVQVDPSDSVQTNGQLGDKMALVERPLCYTAKIASAAAGDEGKKVYVKYNNEVQYTPGTNGNFAGTVLFVRDSTHVEVLAPWVKGVTEGGMKANVTLSDAAQTLTKWDVNKTFQMTPTAGRTITLPAVASTSPGDRMTFITLAAFALTLKGNGSENVNGANTQATGNTAYSKLTIESDGTQWFIVG